MAGNDREAGPIRPRISTLYRRAGRASELSLRHRSGNPSNNIPPYFLINTSLANDMPVPEEKSLSKSGVALLPDRSLGNGR